MSNWEPGRPLPGATPRGGGRGGGGRGGGGRGRGGAGGHARAPPFQATHFISVPLRSEATQRNIKQVQTAMVGHYARLEPAMVAAHRAHLTLVVLDLGGEERVDEAKRILEEVVTKAKAKLKAPLQLQMRGLGTFSGGQVVYMSVADSPALHTLTNFYHDLTEAFHAAGIATATQDFTAHVTVAKMSRHRTEGGTGSVTRIGVQAYQQHEKRMFNTERVEVVELCAMGEPYGPDDYYRVLASHPFVPPLPAAAPP